MKNFKKIATYKILFMYIYIKLNKLYVQKQKRNKVQDFLYNLSLKTIFYIEDL